MKKIYSVFDNRGHLCVDCSECTRGLNGFDEDPCCAAKSTKPGKGGCCLGILLSHIEESEIVRLK